jgi:hypothetical protein
VVPCGCLTGPGLLMSLFPFLKVNKAVTMPDLGLKFIETGDGSAAEGEGGEEEAAEEEEE